MINHVFIFLRSSNIRSFIYSLVFFTIYGYITNLQYDQLPVGLIAQLVATSFPGSLILPLPGASEERSWLGLVTCHFDNREHQGGVLCNQHFVALSFVARCDRHITRGIYQYSAFRLKFRIISVPTFT